MHRTFLRPNRLVTGKDRELVRDGVVEIVDGRIGRLGAGADFLAPEDAEVVGPEARGHAASSPRKSS